jgi:hypothetical protein
VILGAGCLGKRRSTASGEGGAALVFDVEQRDRLVQVVLRASDDEVASVVDRIGEAICVPPDRARQCLTPWTLLRSPLDDLNEPQRSEMRALLDDA